MKNISEKVSESYEKLEKNIYKTLLKIIVYKKYDKEFKHKYSVTFLYLNYF